MIRFDCSACGKTLQVKDELSGRRGKCPACKAPVAIPTTKTAGASPPEALHAVATPPEPKPIPAQPKAAPPVPVEPVASTQRGSKLPLVTGWVTMPILAIMLMGLSQSVPVVGLLLSVLVIVAAVAAVVVGKKPGEAGLQQWARGLKWPSIALGVICLMCLMVAYQGMKDASADDRAVAERKEQIAKAEEAYAAGDLKTAVEWAEEASLGSGAYDDPTRDQAQKLLDQYSEELGQQQEVDAKRLLSQARAAVQQARWPRARKLLDQALEYRYAPSYEEVSDLRGQVPDGIGKSLSHFTRNHMMLQGESPRVGKLPIGIPTYSYFNVRANGYSVTIDGPADNVTGLNIVAVFPARDRGKQMAAAIMASSFIKLATGGEFTPQDVMKMVNGDDDTEYLGGLVVECAAVKANDGTAATFLVRAPK